MAHRPPGVPRRPRRGVDLTHLTDGPAEAGPGFFAVVHAQRACRRFGPEPVADGDVARMLDAAVHAPSAENTQPWVFVVVRDAGLRAAIGDLNQRVWEGHGREHARTRLAPALFDEVEYASKTGLGGAPVLVVVAGDTRTGASRGSLGSSVFPAVQNLLLAANALGYGSALTTMATAMADELRVLVGLPDGVEPMAVVPVGRPAQPLGPPRRSPAASSTHVDRFGGPGLEPARNPT